MTGSFTMELNTKPLQAAFLVAPDAVFAESRRAFQRIGFEVRNAFLEQTPRKLKKVARRGVFYAVYPKRAKKVKSPRPTGRESDFSGPSSDLSDIKLFYAVTSKAAYGHEVGGTFTSKKLMPIPIGKARTKSGATSKRYRKKAGKSGLERSGDAIVIRRSRKGNLIAFRRVKRGKKWKLEPVAVLKKTVTLRAQLGLMKTWRDSEFIRRKHLAEAERQVVRRMGKEFRRALSA